MSLYTHTDVDGDQLHIRVTTREGQLLFFEGVSSDGEQSVAVALDRDAAGAVIDLLTAQIEHYDAQQAKKLKRGDLVTSSVSPHAYTVITDENENGFVELVSHTSGAILTDIDAAMLTRKDTV